jgi:5'-deoxynucleotidase YfbR-like HD superfamily hydrolase
MIIPTHSGKLLNLLTPKVEDICIEDIAIGLCREGRFSNQGKFFYSVGQHSIYACGLAPSELKLELLLHDASEAYIKDIPYGLKEGLKSKFKNQIDYQLLERKLTATINEKFKLRGIYIDTNFVWDGKSSSELKKINNTIKEIDCRLAITESEALYKDNSWIYKGKYSDLKGYDFVIVPMTFEQVYRKFMDLFELYRRDK